MDRTRRTWTAACLTALLAASLPAQTTGGASAAQTAGNASVAQTVGSAAAAQPAGDAQPTVETEPVAHSGDAADDPAIWVDPANPARSAVIGNDKGGGLEVYDLAGRRIQRITEGFFGNVDVHQGFRTGTGSADLVVTYRAGVRVYRMDPQTRQLTNITDTASGSIPGGGEGLCLYQSPVDDAVYAFSTTIDGQVTQFELTDTDGDGRVEGTRVRGWDVGSETEGCVADNDLGDVYFSEENVGIWKYGAEPTDPATPQSRRLVDGLVAAGGHLIADVEGLALVRRPDGTGYLIASAQAPFGVDNFYAVYERQGANAFVRTFRVTGGTDVDGCSHTDGITAVTANLGPAFPAGLFVCQDDSNTAPGSSGNQNFKLVPLERVVSLDPGPPPGDPGDGISFVGGSMSTANYVAHQVTVPSSVSAGDALLLFFGSNTTAAVTAPPGWQEIGEVTVSTSSIRAWWRVATDSDAGTAVGVGVDLISKANLVLAAYRGTSATKPVASFAAVAETIRQASHTTPNAVVESPASWAVSYWTHKDSTSTQLAPPGGVAVRAIGSHGGYGRITALLADSGAPVPAGSYGGLTATAAGASVAASMWTVILAPATAGVVAGNRTD